MEKKLNFKELIKTNKTATIVVASIVVLALIGGGTVYGLEIRLDNERDKALSTLSKDLKAVELSAEFEKKLLKDAEKEFDKAKSKDKVKKQLKKMRGKMTIENERLKAEAEIDALLETSGLTDADVAAAKAEIKKAGGDVAAIKKTVAKTQSTAAAKPKPNKPSGSTSGGSSGSSGGAVSYTHDYNALKQIAINAAKAKGGIYDAGVASWTGSTTINSSVSNADAKYMLNDFGSAVDLYREKSLHAGGNGTVYFNIRMVSSGNGYAYSFVYGYDRGN